MYVENHREQGHTLEAIRIIGNKHVQEEQLGELKKPKDLTNTEILYFLGPLRNKPYHGGRCH